MVGLGEVLLHFVDLLAFIVRPSVLGAIHGTGLQALVNLGKAHLARVGADRLELFFEHTGSLHAELQATGVLGFMQGLVGRELFEAVVPIGQAEDVFILHRGQQLLALGRLETVDGGQIVEQERQVVDLHLLGVVLEFGQGRGQHLHITQQQCFHFLAIAKQRRVRVHLDLDLAGQALFSKFFEQQRALAFRGVFSNHVGELDHNRVCRLGQASGKQGGGAQQRPGKLEHGNHLLIVVFKARCLMLRVS